MRIAALVAVLALLVAWMYVSDKLSDAKDRVMAAEREVFVLRTQSEANARALDVVNAARGAREAGYRDALTTVQSLPALSPSCLSDPRLVAAYDSVQRMRDAHNDAVRSP